MKRIDMHAAGIETGDQYLTVSQLAQLFPAFTEGSIRWIIFNREHNGFDRAVRKIGSKKLVINLREFQNWLEKQAV